MNRPNDELLEAAAPLEIWELAVKQAKRSTHRHHRTGAVIYYGMGNGKKPEIYSKGTSHAHDGGRRVRSIHAEAHAISKLRKTPGGAKCLIVTLTKNDHFASVSKPCFGCATLLIPEVWSVVYSEKTNDYSWIVRQESPDDLVGCRPTKYG